MDSNNMNNQNYQQPYQQQNYQQPYQQQPVYNNYYQAPQVPADYKPISAWGYLGYELLFAIPFVGLIIIIVMAITADNKNVKNFARSYLLLMLIGILLSIIIIAIFGVAAFSFLSQF